MNRSPIMTPPVASPGGERDDDRHQERLNARGWIERLSLRQRAFVGVLCRVGRRCCLSTPNRWYPVEFHTVLPLVHWLPPRPFRGLSRRLGRPFYAREENLNLLSERAFAAMVPAGYRLRTERFPLLGPVSNLMFLLERG
jgi:hypothetical protein